MKNQSPFPPKSKSTLEKEPTTHPFPLNLNTVLHEIKNIALSGLLIVVLGRSIRDLSIKEEGSVEEEEVDRKEKRGKQKRVNGRGKRRHSRARKKMYRSKERLVGFAILHQYSSQLPSTNSFVSVLVNAASNEEAEKSERVFILQLLCSSSSKNEPRVLKLSADDYMRNFDLSPHTFPPEVKAYVGVLIDKALGGGA